MKKLKNSRECIPEEEKTKEKFMQRSVGDSERPQRKLIFIKIENPISPHFPKFFGKGSTIYI
jgi:hypothetical protein